jgi:hypothetical protein
MPRTLNLPTISSYVKSGFGPMNRALRLGHLADSMADKIGEVETEWNTLPLATVTTVYRYGGLLSEYTVSTLQRGQVFVDKAFLSTSTDAGIFDRFGARKGKVYFTISLLPNGATRARDLSTLIGAKDQEAEVLFPRNTRFIITNYDNPTFRSGIYVAMRETRSTDRV